MVSSTTRPYFTPGKGPVPTVQEAGWATGPVWTGGKFRPTGIRFPDRPARSQSQSLYRLSYPAHLRTFKKQNCLGNRENKSRRVLSLEKSEAAVGLRHVSDCLSSVVQRRRSVSIQARSVLDFSVDKRQISL